MTLEAQLTRLLKGVRPRGRDLVVHGRRASVEQTVAWLTELLYQRHMVVSDGTHPPDFAGDPQLIAALQRAAGGRRYYEPGWKASWVREGGVAVTNGVVQLWVARQPGALKPARPRRGAKVELSLPCARNGWLPGYFGLVSAAGGNRAPHPVKVYLNLTVALAPAWVKFLLHDPRLRRLRFEAKLFNDPLSYGRRDPAVMYLEPDSALEVLSRVRRFVRGHRRQVRAQQVAFTLPLEPGFSVGASLEGERRLRQSYGEYRCRLVARAAIRALRDGAPRQKWSGYFARAFADAGGDFVRPWLGAARIDWARLSTSA